MPVIMSMIVSVLILTPALLLQKDFAGQFLFAMNEDIHLGCRNSRPIHARNFQTRTNVESRHGVLEQLRRNARIHQGSEKHVAAHAGEAVEIGNSHGETKTV